MTTHPGGPMTPEQRIIDALNDSGRAHWSGVTVGDLVECDPCGEQFPHWGRWLYHRGQASAAAALDAVRVGRSPCPARAGCRVGRVRGGVGCSV